MKLARIPTVLAVTCTAAILGGLVGGPAMAQGGGGATVKAVGTCSAGVESKLKAKLDNGRIEIEMEVDSNRVGQAWAIVITDNAARVFAGTRVTTAPSGSLSVRALTANRAGTDTIVGTARNAHTGQVCRAVVRL